MATKEISLTAPMRQNLLSLQQTTDLLSVTQNRLATGKRVNTAIDDPANYFTAQGYLSRASDFAARKDAMLDAIQTVKSADNAITAMQALVDQAKGIATSALSTSDTASRAQYATQFNTIMSQIVDLARDAVFKGTNLLNNNTLTVKFNEKGDAKLDINGFIGTTLQNLTLTFVGTSTNSASNMAYNTTTGDFTSFGTGSELGIWSQSGAAQSVSTQSIEAALGLIAKATQNLRDQSKSIATGLNIVTIRQEFTKNMINTLKTGADNLTLADMNEEGANMLMLQTRQTLGITSLSLASQAAQSVLRLF